MLRVAVEGNLGAGKSTFIADMKAHADANKWVVLDEPVNKWTDVNGKGNLLDKYYGDINRWALAFQTYAYQTRLSRQVEVIRSYADDQKPPVLITERSLYSDRFVFGEAAKQVGSMMPLEFEVYDHCHKFYTNLMAKEYVSVQGVVYLRARPETCLERVNKRARSEESSVQLDYLERIHRLHEDWLINGTGPCTDYPALKDTRTLIVNVDDYNCFDPERRAEMIQKVSTFISSLKTSA
ncbi:deoxyguanosine kinase [Crucian carp herpesvirus]|uniref:Deoxyguanosine kinase n=1 Tax=Cyprinid herpesvirus 2 TaxID=317878 RepID=K7PBR1_CYHV2|nr:deoxyguanosine kinase [Cyprinid herpesvirus 2]APB92884.1 deoxyguanosine kinase [Crucian carp herpesvirus]AFJ20601.1 deoxyguanosine kinase [Cyprinid herpesvirus 2]AKC01981.1 hypothetical protein [Cyprinid herpesvirus 2]AMB21601.1 deoxyguanosine kinase [Cyprinid herpesvirus 2]QAU54757.1 deoxyguanosine kinase [Cyprinid herpesvirus 2]